MLCINVLAVSCGCNHTMCHEKADWTSFPQRCAAENERASHKGEAPGKGHGNVFSVSGLTIGAVMKDRAKASWHSVQAEDNDRTLGLSDTLSCPICPGLDWAGLVEPSACVSRRARGWRGRIPIGDLADEDTRASREFLVLDCVLQAISR